MFGELLAIRRWALCEVSLTKFLGHLGILMRIHQSESDVSVFQDLGSQLQILERETTKETADDTCTHVEITCHMLRLNRRLFISLSLS